MSGPPWKSLETNGVLSTRHMSHALATGSPLCGHKPPGLGWLFVLGELAVKITYRTNTAVQGQEIHYVMKENICISIRNPMILIPAVNEWLVSCMMPLHEASQQVIACHQCACRWHSIWWYHTTSRNTVVWKGKHASFLVSIGITVYMMTSLNGNIFHVTGPLYGEFTGPGEFPTQRPVMRSFDVFFDLCQNKPLSKQSWGWWFETLSRSLWRHRNVLW